MTRFALVPADPTDEMLDNVDQEVGGSCYVCRRWNASRDDSRRVFADLLAVSPGNTLLSEILAARDAINSTDNHRIQTYQTKRLLEALAKLGPSP